MTNGILGGEYALAQLLRQIQNQLASLATQPVLANASSDGPNGSLAIQANAVSGQPAITLTYKGGGGSLTAQIYQTTGGAVQITGGLQVSGTKNFVMAHPTVPGYLLRHASTESPVNGVEYWGTGVVGADGTAVVTLPGYFEALTKPDNRIVQLTAQGAPTSLAYDPITAGAFTVRGVSGTPFSWLVKAERATQPGDWPIDFPAEEPGTVPGPPETDTPAAPAPPSLMVWAPAPLEPAPAPDPVPAPAPAPAPDPVPVPTADTPATTTTATDPTPTADPAASTTPTDPATTTTTVYPSTDPYYPTV